MLPVTIFMFDAGMNSLPAFSEYSVSPFAPDRRSARRSASCGTARCADHRVDRRREAPRASRAPRQAMDAQPLVAQPRPRAARERSLARASSTHHLFLHEICQRASHSGSENNTTGTCACIARIVRRDRDVVRCLLGSRLVQRRLSRFAPEDLDLRQRRRLESLRRSRCPRPRDTAQRSASGERSSVHRSTSANLSGDTIATRSAWPS